MLEVAVETRCLKEAKRRGALLYKFSPRYCQGVPDRVLIHLGFTVFVELKRSKTGLMPGQVLRHKEMKAAGAEIHVIRTEDEFKALLDQIEERHARVSGKTGR